jgi:phytanoyl-CoA hydroxylase
MAYSAEFKVYRQQIPIVLVDELVAEHEKFKKGALSIFRAQGSTKFEYPILDEFGNQVNSMQNPHLQGFNPHFRNLVEQVIYHDSVSECLRDFTSHSEHTHYQSMLFDKSTGTKLHQDTWYLDTEPAGSLVGVWFALEDIEREAGPFFLYSNSPGKKIELSNFDFDDLENDQNFKAVYPSAHRYDFLPQKGDILIWHSFVIHGAHMPSAPSKTRKSLTAHFYPKAMRVQDAPIKRLFSIYDHDAPKPTFNPNIKTATVINPFLYSCLCMGMKHLGQFADVFTKDRTADRKMTEIRRI